MTKLWFKQKGRKLDTANSRILAFDKVRDIVLNGEKQEGEKRFRFRWDNKTKDVETKYISRTVRATADTKRIVLENRDSLPFGYQCSI